MVKTKSRRSRNKSNFFKTVKTSTQKALPALASGLKKVGSDVKNITMKSKPGIEKGLGTIYKSVLSGFDLGIKGIKKGINVVKGKSSSSRKSRRGRSNRRRK